MDVFCFIQEASISLFCTHYHIAPKYPPYWLSSKEGIYQWNNVLLIVRNYLFDFLCQKVLLQYRELILCNH